ncbi:MAG: sulfatase family protein [Planctomycetales bacterium]
MRYLIYCVLACVYAAAGCQQAEAAPAKPNFVLIYIDDMGYGDIGPYGSMLNRTPHLDRMAVEGMKLTSFYAAPVCSASRAQLLTGCYAPRVSVPGVFFPAGPKGLNPSERTVAEYLRELGYATTCIGKWHLGDQPKFLPTNQGFDHYFGIPYSNDMQRNSLEDGRRVTPLLRDDKVAELLEDEGQRRVTREYTEEAVKFIEEASDKPFFLYLPHTAMHVPLFPHEDFAGKSKNGTYGDWVEEVDWSVGQILDALREKKLAENTLVIFTSDNGPWASKGAAGGVSGPLRGSKGCTLEGGVREPTIAWWPGTVEAGSSCDAVCGTTDVLPTFVKLGGADGGKPVPGVKIDGKDISPILLGKTKESPHEAWFYYQGTTLQAVRSGPWKLAITPQSIGMGMKERPEDLQSREPRLYNLDEEIGEVTNLADKHPEVVARLQKLIDGMVADIGSGKSGPGVRPAGEVENPVTLYPTQPRKPRGRPTKPGTKATGKPLDWSKVKLGDVYASASAPAIARKAFSINCSVVPADGKAGEGVIVAHGGSAIGYSLYVKADSVIFATRNAGIVSRVESPISLGEATKVVAGMAKDGTLSLKINDAHPVTAKSPGPLKSHPQEDLSIGHDDRNPVDPESPTKPLKASLISLEIVVE